MTSRMSLRAIAVSLIGGVAVLAPAGAAVADSSPTKPRVVDLSETPDGVKVDLGRPVAAPAGAVKPVEVRVVPRGSVAAGDKPAPLRLTPAAVSADGGGKSAPVKVQVVPRGSVAAGDKPSPEPKRVFLDKVSSEKGAPVVVPKGSVAAGERPAEAGSASGWAVTGATAVAFGVLAGAGGLMLRRRSTGV
ncbi:hypothetical protein ABT354_02805 [Streptomyces sp. NPDC000594]|uniref:hypothetical protein n=1 Tax=Streptomyces sp. NPDC000594 TaxID=3154261 RepID=UPI00333462E0